MRQSSEKEGDKPNGGRGALHATHNLVDQRYLQPLSTDPRVPYLAGEQGIITILIAAVIAAAVLLLSCLLYISDVCCDSKKS